ncbi:MAG: voltage-gated sodium channel [Thermoleophilaceae bacterium]|jgi:voltage-gated sodium channel|nr:voltage-gated sodium channel [Thermoleophilaceae bacterium]
MARTCARIADSRAFNFAIFAVIVANAIVLGLETYDSIERDAGDLLGTLNDVFLGIFVVELVIRIAACGRRPWAFFGSGWNLFDFVVIAAAFVPGLRENATLLRLARLARVIRIVRVLPDLRLLVVAVGRSVPGVSALGVMTVLLLYVYGMVGWILFGDAYPDDYGSIGEAMLTLFVLLSLENLPVALEQGMEVSAWAVPFYVSFVLIAALLVLNLLIGVVINSLEEAHELEWEREQEERRARAAVTADPDDDRAVAVEQRLHDLKAAVADLERELHAGRRQR